MTTDPTRHELIETFEVLPKLVLTEDARRGGRLIVRGEFGRAGVPTANKRVYSSRLWQREFQRLQESIRNRQVTGELNHPKDGRADLFNTSHLLTGLTLTPEGIVIGEAEIMEELPGGKVVAAIYRRGGKVGVSSRGFGSTQVAPDGNELVQEDYQLVTFDFVADPADLTAYPELVTEIRALSGAPSMSESVLSESDLQLRLLRAVREARPEIEQAVLARVANDPSKLPPAVQESLRKFFVQGGTAGVAKAELLAAELTEARATVTKVEAERDRAITMARTHGYSLFIERSLAGDENSAEIREALAAVGPLTESFESVKALGERIEGVRAAIVERKQQEAVIQERAALQARSLQEERDTLALELAKTHEALDAALELANQQTLESYSERALRVVPAPRAARAVAAARPHTREEVDALVEGLRPLPQTTEGTAAARARARGWLGSRTRGTTPLDEERSSRRDAQDAQDFEGLGASLGELRQLSGITQD